MSAVAEISKPDTAVLFAAKRDGLRLTKRPRYPLFGQGGEKVGEKPGEAVQFRDGTLRVTEQGVELAEGGILPREEALEWLRGHKLFGDVHEGFTEVAQAAPRPTMEELTLITAATAQHDVATLERLLAAEVEGWDRVDVVSMIRQGLETIERIKAEVRAQIEAEQAAAAEPKPAAKRSAR